MSKTLTRPEISQMTEECYTIKYCVVFYTFLRKKTFSHNVCLTEPTDLTTWHDVAVKLKNVNNKLLWLSWV